MEYREEILGVIRHILTASGGALVTAGYATTDEMQLASGGVVAIVGIIWSVWSKRT